MLNEKQTEAFKFPLRQLHFNLDTKSYLFAPQRTINAADHVDTDNKTASGINQSITYIVS